MNKSRKYRGFLMLDGSVKVVRLVAENKDAEGVIPNNKSRPVCTDWITADSAESGRSAVEAKLASGDCYVAGIPKADFDKLNRNSKRALLSRPWFLKLVTT